jgi:hypothetical protein
MARLSLNQLSSYKVVLPISLFVGTALGLWEVRECATLVSGYLASYNYLGAWLIAVLCSIFGLFLLAFRRTGWIGGGFILAGVLSCGTFYAGMAVLLKQDRVAWRHEKMVPFGPDQKASVVIYFRKGVTRQEASDFDRDVLEEPTRRPPGHGLPAFVGVYLRLLPSQANGHEAIALTFLSNAPIDKLNAYLAKIKADERVETVYSNASPDSIHGGSQRP